MAYYPVNLDIKGRICVVVGGGRVAARKVKGLLACDASVRVISPELSNGLEEFAQSGAVQWIDRSYQQGDLQEAFLVIAATDDETVQQRVYEDAEKQGILVNVADVPPRCNFILPALVRQGDLSVAVSTGGKSPALARLLRKELEKRFGPEYKILVDILGELRPAILDLSLAQPEREELFYNLIHPQIGDWIRERQWHMVEKHVQEVLGEKIAEHFAEDLRKVFRQAD
jgi:precorrin-2 dehydrogenase/sirohydrochlorin ferrochelatase